jgi:curved DNA-binding protein
MSTIVEKRTRGRKQRITRQTVQVIADPGTHLEVHMTGSVVDTSDRGVCVEVMRLVPLGSAVLVAGEFATLNGKRVLNSIGHVCWFRQQANGNYRLGVGFDKIQAALTDDGGANPMKDEAEDLPDYYDILQISEMADAETLQRVYRLMAQRYHPDNRDSGDVEKFRQISEAWKVLGNAQKRAEYNQKLRESSTLRWKLFDQKSALDRLESERNRRGALLTLLYTKRVSSPATPSMTIREIEELLSVPKEQLDFALWYLRERKYIMGAENGRLQITIDGVEKAEEAAAEMKERLGRLISGA